MTTRLIEPRTLKGFRDYLPDVMIPRESLMDIARQTFRSFGFAPIDTPALEYLDVLSGKGSDETDRQLYRFTDNGGRDVGMRFDLTVPLARFAAQHIAKLPLPFKRYHIAPVWRGENTQAGRYREFIQCDFDTIGTLSVVADIEMIVVIDSLMRAIGFDRFTIRINHRAVLTGLLAHLGLAEATIPVLRSLDKLPKIGAEATIAEMIEVAKVSTAQAQAVIAMAVSGDADDSIPVVLDRLAALTGGNEIAAQGISRLRETFAGAIAAGVDPARLYLDASIARGLDYYTGIIAETFLDDLPTIGSVCSGGRYDNLAGLFTKQSLPGVGASLGLDRLLAAMQQLDLLPSVATPAPVLITYFDADQRDGYLRLATELRQSGIACEFYPDAKKLGVQLKYADEKGFRAAIVIGRDEWAQGDVQIKDLARKQSVTVKYSPGAPEAVVDAVAAIMNQPLGNASTLATPV